MKNLFKKFVAFLTSSVCMLTFVGLSQHQDVKVANAATNKTFNLVTDISKLKEGTEIIITDSTSKKTFSVQNKNNWGSIEITEKNGLITLDTNFKGQIFTLGKGIISNTYSIGYGTSNFLYAASSSSNHLKTQTKLDDNGSWSIECDITGIATIKANGTNSRNKIRYNSSGLFSCYSSGQGDIKLYYYENLPEPTVEQELSYDYMDGNGPIKEASKYKYLPKLPEVVDQETKYFDGWYTEKEFTSLAEENTPLYKPTTLYAKWVDEFSIKYNNIDPNGGITQKYTKRLKVQTIDIVEPESHKFIGWFTTPTFKEGTEFNFSNPVENDIQLYGKWLERFTVKFYDSDDTILDSIGILAGETISETQKNVTLSENKLFKYWYDKDDTSKQPFDFKNGVSKNLDLYPLIVDDAIITLSETDKTSMLINETKTITATVSGEYTNFKWSYSNDGLITYKENGESIDLKANKVGSHTLKATVKNELNQERTVSVTVDVKANDSQLIDSKSNIYNLLGAKFSSVEKEMFVKVTTIDEVTTGEYYITNEEKTVMASNSDSNSKITTVKYTDMNNEIDSLKDNAFIINVLENANGKKTVTIQSKTTEKYLSYSSQNINSITLKGGENNIEFDISKSTSRDELIISKKGLNSGKVFLRYNSGINGFKLYGDGNMGAVSLFKLGTGAATDYTEVRTRLAINLDKAFIDANNSKGFKLNTEVTMPNGKVVEKELTSFTQNENGSRTYVLAIRFTKPENGEMNFAAFKNAISVKPYLTFGDNADKYYLYDTAESKELEYNLSVQNVINSYLKNDSFMNNPENAKSIEILKDIQSKIK